MYGDEDDEMEELDEDVENIDEGGIPLPASDAVAVNDNDGIADYSKEESGRFNGYTPQQTIFSPQEQLQAQQLGSDLNNGQSQKSRPTIVDYGHEEGAMSQEGRIKATATPQSLEPDQPETDAMDYATNESEADKGVVEAVELGSTNPDHRVCKWGSANSPSKAVESVVADKASCIQT